jgi:hypothetical protein
MGSESKYLMKSASSNASSSLGSEKEGRAQVIFAYADKQKNALISTASSADNDDDNNNDFISTTSSADNDVTSTTSSHCSVLDNSTTIMTF